MMMPANYSAIAENELTYVTGGNIWDAFPAVMNASNWRTFGTNLISIIGNTTMTTLLSSTIGVLFSGNASADALGSALEDAYWNPDDIGNTVLSWVGGLAAIYTLGLNAAKTLHNDKVIGIQGKAL